jgi:hypothetical protein
MNSVGGESEVPWYSIQLVSIRWDRGEVSVLCFTVQAMSWKSSSTNPSRQRDQVLRFRARTQRLKDGSCTFGA